MKKSILLVVAAAATLLVLVAALATSHFGHVAAAARRSLARHAPVAAKGAQDEASDDDLPAVIRFATNPAPVPPFLVNDLDNNVISTASWHGKVVPSGSSVASRSAPAFASSPERGSAA